MFFIGASPPIFPIGNSKVVVVVSVLALLSLLAPMMNSSNPSCSRCSSSCVCDGPADVINACIWILINQQVLFCLRCPMFPLSFPLTLGPQILATNFPFLLINQILDLGGMSASLRMTWSRDGGIGCFCFRYGSNRLLRPYFPCIPLRARLFFFHLGD